MILADDVGLGNLGCTGGPFKTPNIDALAKGGEVPTKKALAAELRAALVKEDLTAVRATAAAARQALGEKAGIPEVADKYLAAPKGGRWLSAAEAQLGFTAHFTQLERLVWWRVGMEPAKLTQPLRAPVFGNAGALLSLGQDDRVYLAYSDRVLRCKRDGSQPVLGVTAPMLIGATANAQGLIAHGHAHFQKNVVLSDADFNVLGRFTRIGDYNFTAPAGVASGPSGDFYVLDQGHDQVIRFHPDGIRCAFYRIPHEEYPDKRHGYLTRFRVCEQTRTLYVVNWQNLRCFSIESPEYQCTPKLKWEIKDPHRCTELSYGYGGFDVDERGILYLMAYGDQFLTSHHPDGKFLKKIPLAMGAHKTSDPTRVLGLAVSKGEAFVKRAHDTELFLRFNLDTGELLNDVRVPADLASILRAPATADGGKPIAPVKSALGIPAGRKVVRVLFIGNSQVSRVRDIPDMVEAISRAASNQKAPIIVSDEVLVGGVGLEGYWKDGLAQKRIAAGGWDTVVLNEIIYSFGMTSKEKFADYAGKFDAEIKKAGAKTLWFATADVHKKRELHGAMYQDALAFARAHQGRVAGAGMAWLKAWEKDPTLDFHYTDRVHPNALGCYFNACVIYAALTDSNPSGPDTGGAATPAQAALLQQIAWQQAQEDRRNEKK